MKNINWETIGNAAGRAAKAICKVVVYGTLFNMACKRAEIDLEISGGKKADYSTAIEAIMKSSMHSSYKSDAVKTLKHDADEEYYKSVISVVNSGAHSSYIIDMIKCL